MFAGDWHGSLDWAVGCVRLAADHEVDAIVQLGDFGIWPGRGGMHYLHGLEDALAVAGLPLYFVDGNHEDFPQLLTYPLTADGTRKVRPHIHHLPRGHRWSWDGVEFLALGGATSLDRPQRVQWLNWWPEEEITAAEADDAASGGRVDVMLTHDCPSGVSIPGINPETDRMWPREELRRANKHRDVLGFVVDHVQPDRLLHGHFHKRYDSQRGRTLVTGLDMDGTDGNTLIVDLEAWT
jgi:predicted phosphodiesterase